MTPDDCRRVYYYVVWPNLLVSLHPDYVLDPPGLAGRRRALADRCDWFFDPATMARPDFDPTDAIEFWDLTNRQDWHVCELQQQGTRSRAYTPGRYSNQEDSVHAFDLMCADRYAGDGVRTARDIKEPLQGLRPEKGRRAATAIEREVIR